MRHRIREPNNTVLRNMMKIAVGKKEKPQNISDLDNTCVYTIVNIIAYIYNIFLVGYVKF